jgi:ribosomal subunit interface protein
MMQLVEELELIVTTHGVVPEAAKQYATDKITALARFTRKPILFAQVRLTLEPNPARERPAIVEATLDVNGQAVRGHLAGHDFFEAIDLLDGRLRRQLDRHESRQLNRIHESNGDLAAPPLEYAERAVEDREVVRHKTFAMSPIRCDEAAFDLDMLGHSFYLYVDLNTGADSVIYHSEEDGHLELMQASDGPVEVPQPCAADVRAGRTRPPELTLFDAEERLDAAHEPFVFFVNTETGRGNVVYRRLDGHYGLITPA